MMPFCVSLYDFIVLFAIYSCDSYHAPLCRYVVFVVVYHLLCVLIFTVFSLG